MADEDRKPDTEEKPKSSEKEVVSYARYRREVDELTTERDTLKGEIANRDKQLADLTAKATDAEALQKALDEAKADNEKFQKASEETAADMRRDFAIDSQLISMGARNVKAARALIKDIDKAVLDGEKVSGVDFDAVKKDNPYMFADQQRFDTGGMHKGSGKDDGLADFKAQFGIKDEGKE